MKILLTMDEVRMILRKHAQDLLSTEMVNPEAPTENFVTFVHEYSDGSGKTDIETLGAVSHVEILVP